MLLRRLAYPTQLCDVEMHFRWERSCFSHIHRACASLIFERWMHALRFDKERLTPAKLDEFAKAVESKGAPLDVISAFIKGTLDPQSCPVCNQRLIYNGWKCIHCLKFYSLVTPDGIHIHVYGPIEGCRHDATLFKQSGLATILDKYFYAPDGKAFFIYGDPAYGIGPYLLSPFKGPAVTEEQALWNSKMSKVREAVEWDFRDLYTHFAFLSFTKKQESATAAMWTILHGINPTM